MKLPAFQPRTDWRPPKELPSWRGARRIAIDLETRDPDLTKLGPGVRRDGRVIGVGFAIEDGPACYLPIGHSSGNLDPAVVWAYLRDQARETTATIVTANGQYDHDYLLENGVDLTQCRWFDVQIAEPLIDELQMSYSLESIATRRGVSGKDEGMLRQFADCWGVDPKKGMWQLPAHAVGAYAEQDCRLPLELARLQEIDIEREKLERVFDMESRLQPVLLKMRRRGVAVDFDRVDRVEKYALEKEKEALDEIARRSGHRLSPDDTNKTSAWMPLISQLGITLPRTATGKPSLTKDILESLNHPLCDLIRRAKKFSKLRTTFCVGARKHAVNGRIHCTFNQLRRPRDDGGDEQGARYGRLSCVDPNLQQQPSPDRDPEIGKPLRSIFVPDDGGTWACLDYSQQEPRWLVHFAELIGADKAHLAAEAYRNDPSTDNHDMTATMINPGWPSIADPVQKKVERGNAKIINLALTYGMGEAKLCNRLGLPTEEMVRVNGRLLKPDDKRAKKAMANGEGRLVTVAGPEGRELMDRYHAGVPFVREFARKAERVAAASGYVFTVLGRRCRFPRRGRGYDWCHKAGNRIVQGSSGDQTKMAMVLADDAGVPLQLQVHDELDLTVWDVERETSHLAEIMLRAVPCNVPHKVDIETGPSWGEIG